jgi:hypothetical protein
MMTNISRQLTTGALALAGTFASFTNAVSAATLSGGSFNNGLEITEITQTGTLSKFDSSLGTLTSVKLTLSAEWLQSFTARNTSQQSQTARVRTSTDISFDILGLTSFPDFLSFGADTGTLSYTSGQSRSFGPFSDSDSVDVLFPPTASLAFFSGLAGQTFDVTCSSLSGLTVTGGGGNIDSTQNTQAGCGASIEYTYTEREDPQGTPEPSTMLAILAVAGAGALARRKS